MDIGIALPTMCRSYTRASTVDWCRLADQGPFSSVSAGERMTFHNPEVWTTMAAAAAVTERVRIIINVAVLPAHPVALVAKQAATLDVLSEGRLTLGVGVGGREHDYRSLGSGFDRRHARLDAAVGSLRALWAGKPPFEGADPVGPPCVQDGGPPVLASPLGPKSMARSAKWADGFAGFTVTANPPEVAAWADRVRGAWQAAGRDGTPPLVSGTFYDLGGDDPDETLHQFALEYLAFLGPDLAARAATQVRTSNPDAINRALDGAEAAGIDEFILVPGSTDIAALEALAELVERRG